MRTLAAREGLPGVVWALLVGGAVVTIVFTYFFSTPNPSAQYAMTALYVAAIAFVVILVGLLELPFSGDVRVGPEAFESALATFRRLEGR